METNPPQAEPEEPAKDSPREEKRSRRRRVPKVVVRLGAVLLAVVIALILTGLTVDLGPWLRERAELEGSKYLKRPLHIGRISARFVPGTFVFDDLMIEGLTPDGSPLPDRQAGHRAPAVVDDCHPQADRRVGGHDRLAHGRRDVSQRPSQQLSEDHARAQRPAGTEPLHHDGPRRSMRRAASSPTRITARRGAPSAATST